MAALVCGTACTERGFVGIDPTAVFLETTERVVVEVDYQAGAEPYTLDIIDGQPAWQILDENLRALVERSGTDIEVPYELSEMRQFQGPPLDSYSVDDLLALSGELLDERESGATIVYHVMFLDGAFRDKQGVRRTVLGVSITGTRVIALFKPIIVSAVPQNNQRALGFVEQSTVVHELGHATGLVNSGLEMVRDHHDHANGAHCTNEDCVMYYLNEGWNDIQVFSRRYNASSNPNFVLFGDDCIEDALNAMQ